MAEFRQAKASVSKITFYNWLDTLNFYNVALDFTNDHIVITDPNNDDRIIYEGKILNSQYYPVGATR